MVGDGLALSSLLITICYSRVMFVVGCIFAGLYLLLLAFKVVLSLRYTQKIKIVEAQFNHRASNLSDITIMQPILSGDPLLESTLRYNLEHTPHEVSFIWLIDEDDTEGIRLTKAIAKEFTNIEIVYCPKIPDHINPKLFKLHAGYAHVKSSLIAILDDDTRLSKNSLETAQQHLNHADIYTGLPYYLPAKTFWSVLLTHFVNQNSALTYLPILNFTKAFSINGMFYMLRKKTLEELGGFSAFWHQLTDDYAMAKAIKQQGGSILQGITTQAVQTTVHNLFDYLRIMHRWFLFALLQVNDQKGSVKYLLLIFLALPTLLFWLSLIILTQTQALFILIPFLMSSFAIIRYVQWRIIPTAPPSSFFISLMVECLQPLHILHALLVKQIRWRKRRIHVFQDGTFHYQKEPL